VGFPGDGVEAVPGRLIPRPLYRGHDLVTIWDATIGCPDCDAQMILICASMSPPMAEWRCDSCGSEVRDFD